MAAYTLPASLALYCWTMPAGTDPGGEHHASERVLTRLEPEQLPKHPPPRMVPGLIPSADGLAVSSAAGSGQGLHGTAISEGTALSTPDDIAGQQEGMASTKRGPRRR